MAKFWWQPSCLVRAGPFGFCPHLVEGAREPSGASFEKALIPFVKAYDLKAPSPNAVTSGIRF